MSYQKYLSEDQVLALLGVVERNPGAFDDAKRVHAMIFLGFFLATRISEMSLLNRKHFEGLDHGRIVIPTLKRTIRIAHECSNCGRRFRLASKRIGKQYPCPECLIVSTVKQPRQRLKNDTPEFELPFVESHVQEYLREYLDHTMRPGQFYLFESKNGQNEQEARDRKDAIGLSDPNAVDTRHATRNELWTSFKQALALAGLPEFKPHALRHGRAMQLLGATGDIKLVQAYLRHSSSATTDIYLHWSNNPKQKEVLERASPFAGRRVAT